jgi:hypothetical protein
MNVTARNHDGCISCDVPNKHELRKGVGRTRGKETEGKGRYFKELAHALM